MTAVTTRPAAQTVPSARRTSLDNLRRARVVLAVGALIFGLAGVWTVQSRTDGAHDAVSHSGPLTAQAELLYHSLSDADATAATAFLSVGLEPPQLRARYLQDLSDASDALTTATADAAGAKDSAAALQTISENLPLYAGEIESARANNRLGYPLGARYLNQASMLMHGTVLKAAQSLDTTESGNLVSAEARATAFPWLELGVGLIVLGLLLFVQLAESGRTRRLLSPGLVAATLAMALSVLWLGGAFVLQDQQVDKAKADGSAQATVLSRAQIQALTARSDEMLTLVGRGSAPGDETDYKTVDEPALRASLADAETLATDPDGQALAQKAVADEAAWQKAHVALRAQDDQNHYANALQSALTPKASDGSVSADAAFGALDGDLRHALEHAQSALTTHSKSASDDLVGLEIGLAVLGLAMAAAVVLGLGRRISEYQ